MPFGRVHAEVWDDMNMLIFPSYTCLCGIIGAAVTLTSVGADGSKHIIKTLLAPCLQSVI